MPQAAEQSTVVRFPTKRKRPYGDTSTYHRNLPEGVTRLSDAPVKLPPYEHKTPYADLQRTPETILLAALLWSLREGSPHDRGLFTVVKHQVAKGVLRYEGDEGFAGAERMLQMIDAAAYDAEQG